MHSVGEWNSVSHCTVGSFNASDYIKLVNTAAAFVRRTAPWI